MLELTSLYSPAALASLPEPKPLRGWVTGVGSRDTPPDIQDILRIFAAVLYSLGYGWRSGGARGADEAFEQGVLTYPHYKPGNSLESLTLQVYLPWNGFAPNPQEPFKKYQDYAKGYVNSSRLAEWRNAEAIAMSIHPLGERLQANPGVLKLHTRNIFQVLGYDLRTPSRCVYLYAKPSKDGNGVQGGTGTAYRLAKQHSVPTVNLYESEPRRRMVEFLKEYALRNLGKGLTQATK